MRVGYLNAILAQERGNLNELISKSSNARGISQGNVKASRDVYSVDVPGVMKKKKPGHIEALHRLSSENKY